MQMYTAPAVMAELKQDLDNYRLKIANTNLDLNHKSADTILFYGYDFYAQIILHNQDSYHQSPSIAIAVNRTWKLQVAAGRIFSTPGQEDEKL